LGIETKNFAISARAGDITRSMKFSKRLNRKTFLAWGLSSASTLAIGCGEENPAPALGTAGSGGGGSGGSGGMAAGSSGSFSAAGSGGATGGTGGGAAGSGGSSGGGSAGGGGSAPAPNCGAQLQVKITADHGHVLSITMADVTAGVTKVYDTKGTSNHGHFIQITDVDFKKLQMGGTVRKVACNDGHEHEYIVNCVGNAEPDTTSGVANYCDPEHECGASKDSSFCPVPPDKL
jgi:hypothetical protein